MEFVKKLQSGFIDVSKINRYRGHSSNDWEECKQRATSSSSKKNNECYTFDVDGFADDNSNSVGVACEGRTIL
jgi:hypothetical protein